MSMENAILELAAGMKELAAAVRSAVANGAQPQHGDETVYHQRDFGTQSEADRKVEEENSRHAERDEQAQKEEAALADAERKALKEKREEDKVAAGAEMEAAVAKVEADAKKRAADAAEALAINTGEKPNPYAETSPASNDEATPLDYAKDLRPILLQVVKGGKRPDVEKFLAAAGVKKADELPAAQLPALLALATKLHGEIEAAKAAA